MADSYSNPPMQYSMLPDPPKVRMPLVCAEGPDMGTGIVCSDSLCCTDSNGLFVTLDPAGWVSH